VLPSRLEAPLGHPGPSLSCPRQPREQPAPPAPPLAPRNPQDQLTWTADGRQRAAAQLSWSSARRPARARAETGGGGDGEGRHVLRGLGSVGSVGSKLRSAVRLDSAVRLRRRRGAALCLRSAVPPFGAGARPSPPPPPVQARAGTGALVTPSRPGRVNQRRVSSSLKSWALSMSSCTSAAKARHACWPTYFPA